MELDPDDIERHLDALDEAADDGGQDVTNAVRAYWLAQHLHGAEDEDSAGV